MEILNDIMLFVWAAVALMGIVMEASRFYGLHFPVALGGIGGLICQVAGLSLLVQVIVAAVLIAIGYIALRPLFVKLVASRNEAEKKLDPDDFVGKTAVVATKVDLNLYENTGRVRVDDHEYRARPSDDRMKYNVGVKVKIVGVDGNCLIVEK